MNLPQRADQMTPESRLAERQFAIAKKMLRDVAVTLENGNVWYCLDGTTLLGLMSESRLPPRDGTMNLFVTEQESHRVTALTWKFRSLGYSASVRKHREDWPPFKKGDVRGVEIRKRKHLFSTGPVQLEILIKYRQGDNLYWTEGPQHQNVKKCVPTKYFKLITSTEFEGHKYWIPATYDEYLTFRYQNWRTWGKERNPITGDSATVTD